MTEHHKLAAAASALHDTLEAADGKAQALKVPDSMHKVQDRHHEAIT